MHIHLNLFLFSFEFILTNPPSVKAQMHWISKIGENVRFRSIVEKDITFMKTFQYFIFIEPLPSDLPSDNNENQTKSVTD